MAPAALFADRGTTRRDRARPGLPAQVRCRRPDPGHRHRCRLRRRLMFAWMNAEALALTLETRVGHFWSRSRGRLWRKGEDSGNVLDVAEVLHRLRPGRRLAEGAGAGRRRRLPHRRALLLLPRPAARREAAPDRPEPRLMPALNPFLALCCRPARLRRKNGRRAGTRPQPAVNPCVGRGLIPRR